MSPFPILRSILLKRRVGTAAKMFLPLSSDCQEPRRDRDQTYRSSCASGAVTRSFPSWQRRLWTAERQPNYRPRHTLGEVWTSSSKNNAADNYPAGPCGCGRNGNGR